MTRAREAIIQDQYPAFVKEFFVKLYGGDMYSVPMWAVTALRGVGVVLGGVCERSSVRGGRAGKNGVREETWVVGTTGEKQAVER